MSKKVYFVKFKDDEQEMAIVSDRVKEEWAFGVKIKIYSLSDFWKMAERRRKWLFYFQNKNLYRLGALKRLYTAPMPHIVREIFGIPKEK